MMGHALREARVAVVYIEGATVLGVSVVVDRVVGAKISVAIVEEAVAAGD